MKTAIFHNMLMRERAQYAHEGNGKKSLHQNQDVTQGELCPNILE
jgi:hypothetical protein